MSHAVEITTTFYNWDALKTAFKNLGWGIKENSKINTYPSDPKRNDIHPFVATNPNHGGYDIGLRLAPEDGQVKFTWDPYGGSIEKALGKDFVKLKIEYDKALIDQHYEESTVESETYDYSIISATA